MDTRELEVYEQAWYNLKLQLTGQTKLYPASNAPRAERLDSRQPALPGPTFDRLEWAGEDEKATPS
ncbi:hypothetical protein H4582DRAFT_2076042 [Lactarius indigo]|nr:hypothetical protein H4582DRAFT_2076042 [Lactarius indigo]